MMANENPLPVAMAMAYDVLRALRPFGFARVKVETATCSRWYWFGAIKPDEWAVVEDPKMMSEPWRYKRVWLMHHPFREVLG